MRKGVETLKLFQDQPIAFVLLDIRMPPRQGTSPDEEGLVVLREIKERFPELSVIMVTASAEIDTAIRAIWEGAYYYITKPPDVNKLSHWASHALAESKSRTRASRLEAAISVRDETEVLHPRWVSACERRRMAVSFKRQANV